MFLLVSLSVEAIDMQTKTKKKKICPGKLIYTCFFKEVFSKHERQTRIKRKQKEAGMTFPPRLLLSTLKMMSDQKSRGIKTIPRNQKEKYLDKESKKKEPKREGEESQLGLVTSAGTFPVAFLFFLSPPPPMAL